MSDKETGADWSILVGKYFQVLGEEGLYAERQGVIVGEPYAQCFVVNYLSMLTGAPGWGEQLVTLDTMLQGQWRFYACVEDMREAYEYGGLARPLNSK